MFSSNQILEISGSLGNKDLKRSLKLALNLNGSMKSFNREDKPTKCVYQLTEDGLFCIGWNPNSKLIEGWKEFSFDFDLKLVADVIEQFLLKQELTYEDMGDGSYDRGFLMKAVPEIFNSTWRGIKNPSYGLVCFEVYPLFFSK